MHPDVLLKGRLRSEGFPTLLAFVGSLSGVCPHVDVEGCREAEGPTALHMHVASPRCASSGVSGSILGVKGFPILLT